jgi:hypothetical protein
VSHINGCRAVFTPSPPMLSFGGSKRLLAIVARSFTDDTRLFEWDGSIDEKESDEDKDRDTVWSLMTPKELPALSRNSLGFLANLFARCAERVVPWPRIARHHFLADAANCPYSKRSGKR